MATLNRMVAAGLLLCATLTNAHAADPVVSTLSVYRVVAAADGRESLVPATAAMPNDRLQYVAEVHNGGATAVHGVTATLPLPPGTDFLAGSQLPVDGVLASLDGKTFSPLPLKRMVVQADGTSREQLVPTGEYRFLAWAAHDIPANQELRVSARVAISGATQKP